MQHLDEGTIHSWLDGALSADEAARVQAHVAECPQCATAVAEARGFIAASSRILTALDHVPRGVVPAAPSIKWYNRAALRAAAAVLVVAVGSLMVVRNSDRVPGSPATTGIAGARQDTVQMEQTSSAPRDTALVLGSPVVTPAPKPHAPPLATASAPREGVASLAPTGKPTARAELSGKSAGGAAQSNVATRESARDATADTAIGSYAATTPPVAAVAAAAPQPALTGRVAGAAMLRAAAADQPPLKVVGTPRMIGAKVTLYEVAPGDTVTFTEVSNIYLESVVVTGATAGEPQARRSTAKSAASAPTQVSSPSPAAPSPQVEVTNGVTTISWQDTATGSMLRLSGHMSLERLKEIKLRIERERAAAAAKKRP